MSDVYAAPNVQSPDVAAYAKYVTEHPGGPDYRAPVGGVAPDDWSDVSAPSPQNNAPQAKAAPDDWSDVAAATAPPPARQVGAGEAAVRGAVDTASFGLTPAIQGLQEAANVGKTPEQVQQETELNSAPQEAPGMAQLGEGIARLFGSHPDPEARAAYERGRQAALQDQEQAEEQHTLPFWAGRFIGAMASPGFGVATPGTLGTRLVAGAVGGAANSALYSGGSAVSRGESLPDVLTAAGEGALVGAPTGAVLNGAFGSRVAQPAATAGQKAAQTAQDLGAPLPRGVTSDRPFVQSTTAKLQSMPISGDKISQKLKATESAAGGQIGDIADQMTGGVTDRAAADAVVRPGLQSVVDSNKQAIDAAYNGVRGQIDQNARFTMPRTDATLKAIQAERKAAGHKNPAEGLDQFQRVAKGATFNGAHRARVDARNAGDVLNPHPGYNAADFNRLTRAMTADIRDIVQAAATGANKKAALAAFDKAEAKFGELAEQNKLLNRLINAKGESAISTLLGGAKEKGGNLRLLAQLRQKMSPQDFEQIGGTLLNELGQRASKGEFSLAQFVTNWNKLSAGAKQVLFSPQHLRNIEDIVGMGEHIKGALAKANTSHTSDVLILWDVLRAAAETGVAVQAGVMNPLTAAGIAASVALPHMLTLWLASPAKAASMAAWSRSYRALAAAGSPARIAAFRIATRNLANTLGLDVGKAIGAAEGLIAGRADQNGNQNQ